MSELWVENRRERDLRSCEGAVTNKAQKIFVGSNGIRTRTLIRYFIF